MATSFHTVNQSLRADRGLTSTASLAIAVVLLAGWLVWAFETHITRYEISDTARLEVNGAGYPLEAGVAGRLRISHLELGKEVHAGEVLAELDSDDEQLNLSTERVHYAAIGPQLAALRAQIQSEKAGGEEERRVLTLSVNGARAQFQQAEAEAALAQQEAKRIIRLHNEGIVADTEAQRAKANAESKRAAADSLRAAMARLEPELEVREQDRQVRLRELSEEAAKLDAERDTSAVAIKRLEYERERRKIVAQVSGRLVECATLRPGSHISEGQRLGVILPKGNLEVTAEFQPSAALGKVRPGQRAIVRLQGFPWAQYGTVAAHVSEVASEIRDGKVRVQLTVDAASHSKIPFQHGLPGTVEVEVERVSPAALLLRSAGALVGAR